MGKPDISIKQWLRDKTRFADLFNGVVFQGKQIVTPDTLVEINSESDIIIEDKDLKTRGIERRRDIIMQWNNVSLVVLAVENQQYVSYAMPVRNMLYDSLAYIDQMNAIWRSLSDEDKSEVSVQEVFSRFRKGDRIYPVITIVFYFGTETSWDGALSLHDMFLSNDADETYKIILKNYVPNYRINLLDISNIKNVERFKSDLHIILDMLKYKNDKEKLYEYIQKHKDYFECLDNETRYAAETLLNADGAFKKMMDKNIGVGGVNMCKAIKDIREDGKIEGNVLKTLTLISRKVTKGKSLEVIADELEDTVDNIQPLYDAVIECGAEKEAEQIYEHLQKMMVNN